MINPKVFLEINIYIIIYINSSQNYLLAAVLNFFFGVCLLGWGLPLFIPIALDVSSLPWVCESSVSPWDGLISLVPVTLLEEAIKAGIQQAENFRQPNISLEPSVAWSPLNTYIFAWSDWI